MSVALIEDSTDGGSTEGEDRVSKRDFYRIEDGDRLPTAEQHDPARQLVGV